MGRGSNRAKGNAKPDASRKLPRHQGARVRDLEKRLAEALQQETEASKRVAEAVGQLKTRDRELVEAHEQQAATSEILRVISSSPTDTQPVFETIAATALRLCNAKLCTVFRFDGKLIHLVALHQVSTEGAAAYRDAYPAPPGRAGGTHRAILTRSIVHIHDIREDPEYELQALARANDFGCVLSVPMLRGGQPVGAITVGREAGRSFSDEQIALLKTFASQALIAIENVRLFNETKEALDQQTATAEILRVISSSPTNVKPVFDAILASATTLCDAHIGLLGLYDGTHYRQVAHLGVPSEFEKFAFGESRPQDRLTEQFTGVGRMIATRAPVHIADLMDEPLYREGNPARVATVELGRARTFLAVPMLRDDRLVGGIVIYRPEVRPFSDNQIALLKTFADQAVIAIENVRLFTELQEKNRALTQAHAQVTEALDQQTATSEILRVISSSPTDVQPVFATIAENAVRLCNGLFGGVLRLEGEALHLAGQYNLTVEGLETWQRIYPAPLSRYGMVGRAILDRSVTHVPDIEEDPEEMPADMRAAHQRAGFRSVLAVPMLRDGNPLGGIFVARRKPEPFTSQQIELLQTFADQAVIAIENVRLFKELEARNVEIEDKSRQLEVVSQHKSEFLANMSHELRTPLNAVIGFSEVLSEKMFGDLNEKQEEYLRDIYASGQHLLSLINDILDLSKIEAGRMELEVIDFDLPTALENALTLVRERAARRSIALHTTVDERLGQVQADERKIRQVLLNLLSNAIKFTPEGGRIDVQARPVYGFTEVSVSDTGVGIAPEDQVAVFEEFRQVGAAEKKVEGTGLGLALSRKFIELHGGKIWVKSQVGEGSTFTFTIPVRRGE